MCACTGYKNVSSEGIGQNWPSALLELLVIRTAEEESTQTTKQNSYDFDVDGQRPQLPQP